MPHILIVGANQGIGYYITKQLLEDSNKVSVLDIETDEIGKLKKQFPDQLHVIHADATNEKSLQQAVQSVLERFGEIDVAIHNACMITFDSEPETNYKTYRKVMDVNYYGALRLSKIVLPYMRKKRKGKIIFTSSGVGVTGFGNISPYASSKGVIEPLAKCLHIENEEYGISFHIMHPPLTNTASASGLSIPKEFKANAEKVGRGLGKQVKSHKFMICHSWSQTLQMQICYRYPLFMGKMMWKMTKRAEKTIKLSNTLLTC